MPTYEYACKACDHNFEIVQSFSEDTLTTCPACEQDELRKVYNAAGIIFKGDGWHIKDYGSSSSATSGAGASGEGGSSDTTSDSSGSSTSTGSKSKGSDSKGSSNSSSSSSTSGGGDSAAKPAAS